MYTPSILPIFGAAPGRPRESAACTRSCSAAGGTRPGGADAADGKLGSVRKKIKRMYNSVNISVFFSVTVPGARVPGRRARGGNNNYYYYCSSDDKTK